MKLQELPPPYRELAEMRRVSESELLIEAFSWDETPEGHDFWYDISKGGTPEIPAPSLEEMDYKNARQGEFQEPKTVEPTLIGGKTDTEWMYLFAGQAMQGVLANPEMTCENIALEAVLQAKALLTQLKKEVENV